MTEFMSHGQCWLWTWPLIWLHVISDCLIAASYFAIPIALLIIISKRKDFPFKLLFFMFSMFIIACGLTHVMGVITVWKPWFWTEGYVKLWCAIVSVITAIGIYPLLPKIISIKDRSEYEKTIEKLELIIKNKDKIAEELERLNLTMNKLDNIVKNI